MFIGIGLDDATRGLLVAHLKDHVPTGVPGRAVTAPNWHVTLRFLGSTTDLAADKLLHKLGESDLPEAFRVRFGGMGAFPRESRATVVWIGIRGGGARMGEIAQACEIAAIDAGISAEERPFHPHLTIARLRPPTDVRSLIDSFPPFDVKMRVSGISLFESHIGSGGPRYEELDQIPL